MKVTRDGAPIGQLNFKLYEDDCPKTTANFIALCSGQNKESLSYKDAPFHRIVTDFMIQGGDITNGDGSGGMSIYGPSFPDENLRFQHKRRGILSMANAGPNSNNSQFFITLAECGWLDGIHCVFGEIVAKSEDGGESEKCLDLLHLGGSTSGGATQEFLIAECGVMHSKL